MDKSTLVELLTLQYIRDKAADSALEYVKLYRKAKDEIEAAYDETEPSLNIDNLI